MSIYGNNTPEMEPSRMPAIAVAAVVGIILAIISAAIGIKGGLVAAIPALAALGTYKLVRSNQLKK